MKTTTIRFGLATSEITRAIKELREHKADLQRKCELLRQRIAEAIAGEAQAGFSGADVAVTVEEQGNVLAVVASGADAVFIEFGAGVTYNGPAGSSPHPKGQELGFTIGSYGKGKGKNETWWFFRDGQFHETAGTRAQMPMYRAVRSVMDKLPALIQEIWG
jgi:hypothetical protein